MPFINYYKLFIFHCLSWLHIISFYTVCNYIVVFIIIVIAKRGCQKKIQIKHDSYPYTSIIFHDSEIYDFISHNRSFDEFLFTLIKKNIINKLQLIEKNFDIIVEDNVKYDFLFNNNNAFYKIITTNNYFLYDYYYTLIDAHVFSNNDFNVMILNEQILYILSILEQENIRFLCPIYKEQKIYAYVVIYNNSFENKKKITPDDISYFFAITDYATFCLDQLTYNEFYRTLIYQKKILECNLIENDIRYKEIRNELSRKIIKIKQVFIYEQNKKNYKIFNNLLSGEVLDYVQNIFKEASIVEDNNIIQNYYFNEDNNFYSVLATNKFVINKRPVALYALLPFIKKDYGILYDLYYHKRIDKLFFNDNVMKIDRAFFSSFDNGFNIKIIISSIEHKSFFKIITYFSELVGYNCIFISLHDIDDVKSRKIFEYYIFLLEEGKSYYIFFTDIDKSSYKYQKNIIELYLKYLFDVKRIDIKLFFLILHENFLRELHPNVIQRGDCMLFNPFLINAYTEKLLVILFSNYSREIMKKNIEMNIIIEYVQRNNLLKNDINIIDFQNHQNKSMNTLYAYFDDFENNIKIRMNKTTIQNNDFYIDMAIKLKKEALKNEALMKKLLIIYNNNYSKIAIILGIHKSTVSRFFKNEKQ